MRFAEIASAPYNPTRDRLRVCTLYVGATEFQDLKACRLAHGRPTRIIAVRSRAPSDAGCSVDVLCDSAQAAADLLVAWTGSRSAVSHRSPRR